MGNSISRGDVPYYDATNQVFQYFYSQLTELLPANDVIILSELFLLVGLTEDQMDTSKQTHFQESVIKQSVTLTELYQLFIVTTLQKQVKDDDKPTHPVDSEIEKILCDMLKGIPNQVMGTVFCLSRLAYRGFFSNKSNQKNPNYFFTVEDLTQCGLQVTDPLYDLLRIVNTSQLPTDSVTYWFVHFTVQDFLCALYITTLPQDEQEQLLNETFHNYRNVFVFWSGLTRLASHKAAVFISGQLQSNRSVATATQCVYESRQTSLAQPSIPFCLNISNHTLSSYDCLAISTVLSLYPISKLYMDESQICDEGVEMLVKHYPDKNSDHHLEELHFSTNHLSVVGARDLAKIVMKSGVFLKVLGIDWNPIGDDGMSLIIDELKDNKVLVELNVQNCSITANGAGFIGEFLKHENRTLEMLWLSSNTIGDDGVSAIVEGLQCNNTITQLMVDECKMTAKGANCLAELISSKNTLKTLTMMANNVGDDGITAIAGALNKSSIDSLDISECGIGVMGAKVFAKSLLTNDNVTHLRIQGNSITAEGALTILRSAVGNGVCQDVETAFDQNDVEATMLMEILQLREKRRLLKRCHEDSDSSSSS